MILSDERLAEIRKRCEAATPGPWEACGTKSRRGWVVTMTDDSPSVADNIWPNDLEFIAHARQDIPDLLNEIARLERQIAEHVCTLPASISEGLNSGDGTYRP